MHFLTSLLIFLMAFKKYETKYIEGILSVPSTWQFFSRFCFMSNVGTLQYEFEYSQKYLTQSLLLYWDYNKWKSVYHSPTMNCVDRQNLLSVARGQIHNLNISESLVSSRFLCQMYGTNSSWVYCKSNGLIQFSSSVPFWWFLVIANCHSQIGLEITYRVWLRNGQIGDIFFEHFSCDETYILQTDIFFVFAQLIIFVIGLRVGVRLKEKQLLHSTYRIFILSLVLQLWNVFFQCVAYGVYANTGKMNTAVQVIGDSLGALSHIVFILMLLLLSLGYTVICGKLPSVMTISLAVFITIYTITYICLFVLEITTFDPGLVLYKEESQAGLLLLGLQILAWVTFVAGCIYTTLKHKNKKLFYIPLVVFYTLWFWATPALVFIGISRIPLNMKEKIVNGLQLTITFCGQLFYLILTRPNSANSNFPFHLKTSQIDAITFEMADENRENDGVNVRRRSDDNFADLNSMFCVENNHNETMTTHRSTTQNTNGRHLSKRHSDEQPSMAVPTTDIDPVSTLD